MSRHIPFPDEGSLLPPLLACLPTGFASPRPPPALLPLLSPILRQRVQLLSATSDTPTDSWLPLLCWQAGSAEKLASIVESDTFELHPVSGEIEYGELGTTRYRQLDEETLQARVQIDDLELVVIYLWCEGDQEGGGDGWRVSEVIPLADDNTRDAGLWSRSIIGAREEAARNTSHGSQSVTATNTREPYINANGSNAGGIREDDDDDDDYWAQYDKTPGRTPAINRSPMRGESSATAGRARTTSEAEYFEQYSQVQPEMDNDDPSENRENIGESSLNGNILTDVTSRPPIQDHLPPLVHDPIHSLQGPDISEPTANSPTALSDAVSRLEDSATLQSNAEVAIRQHVSTTIKSLFRLCRTSGIDRPEFDELVKTELETLSLLTEDD